MGIYILIKKQEEREKKTKSKVKIKIDFVKIGRALPTSTMPIYQSTTKLLKVSMKKMRESVSR
jgi:hypothetical protein